MKLTVLAWLAGWALLTFAVDVIVLAVWPALPWWCLPAGSAGVLCLSAGGISELGRLCWIGVRGAVQLGRRTK